MFREKLKGFLKKKMRAYMTIEASFIVPLTVMLCILIMMFLFFLYNNCVVYQDCYIAALRGSQVMDASVSEVKEKVSEYAYELLDNQIYQYRIHPIIEVGIANVKVRSGTGVDIPDIGIKLYNESAVGSEREANCKRIDPTELVRAIH